MSRKSAQCIKFNLANGDGVSIANFRTELDQLSGKDEKVITSNSIDILFDYPLSKKLTITLKSTNGFTRKRLVKQICKNYHRIYKQEKKDVGGETENLPHSLNRDTSEGRYGIWGHHIQDLELVEIEKQGRVYHLLINS